MRYLAMSSDASTSKAYGAGIMLPIVYFTGCSTVISLLSRLF